jgi:hypothetical protein
MINSALLLSEFLALALIFSSTAARSQQPHLLAALKARSSR